VGHEIPTGTDPDEPVGLDQPVAWGATPVCIGKADALAAGASLRWIFYINVPVAAATIIAVRRLVDESRATASTRGGRPDLAGALLATAGLVSVVYGLIRAATVAWGSASVVAPIALGVVLLVALVWRERTAPNPLVPLRFFRDRTRVTANVVTLCFSSVFFTLFFLLTLYLQDVEGFSALRTGLCYLPFVLAISVGIGVASKVVMRLGVKVVLGAGFVFGAAGMWALTAITVKGSYLTQLLPGILLMAFGSGLCFRSGAPSASPSSPPWPSATPTRPLRHGVAPPPLPPPARARLPDRRRHPAGRGVWRLGPLRAGQAGGTAVRGTAVGGTAYQRLRSGEKSGCTARK
jgi:hypothetical protein